MKSVLSKVNFTEKDVSAILTHVYSTNSWRIELMGYRVLERICDGSQYEKNKLGNDGFLISMDAKIEKMSKCDVDRRLYILRLLVCLTRNSDSNLLQARNPRTIINSFGPDRFEWIHVSLIQTLKMKHWHTFIFETIEQYPDIELHSLRKVFNYNSTNQHNDSISNKNASFQNYCESLSKYPIFIEPCFGIRSKDFENFHSANVELYRTDPLNIEISSKMDSDTDHE